MSPPRLAAVLMFWMALACARGDYVMSLSSGGTNAVTVARGGAVNLDVVLTSTAADGHNSAIFRLIATAPGLSYESYSWQAPYLNGTLDDDSKPLMKDLPTVLTASTLQGLGYPADIVDVELSNVTGDGSDFTNGTLVSLVLRVPADYQGPESITITGAPSAIANGFTLVPTTMAGSFTITVGATNTAPRFQAIPDQTIEPGQTLTFTIQANDNDVPANHLAYQLLTGPSGATLDPSTGVFVWTPASDQGNTNQTVTVEVTDDGVPPLSATASFNVIVFRAPAPHLTGITVAGQSVTLTWDAVPNRRYRVQYTPDLTSSNWQELAGIMQVGASTASQKDESGLQQLRFYRVQMLP